MAFYIIIFWTLLSSLLGYLRFKYSYWDFQGVQQLKPHFIFGSLFRLKSVHHGDLLHDVYEEFKGKAKIAGTYIFTRPTAVVLDLDLVKTILIKDFNSFVDRADFEQYNAKQELLNGHIFNLPGEQWRSMRTKLTPIFTSGKMKYLFPTIVKVANELEHMFDKERESAENVVNVHDLMARFTTDVIGTCIFGILKNPNAEFRCMGQKLFAHNQSPIRWRLFKLTYYKLFNLFGYKRFGDDMEKYIMNLVREAVTLREQEKRQCNDFIDLLIELKDKTGDSNEPALTIEEMAAQLFGFFVNGFEPNSSNMSYGLFELAKNQQIQDKLRAEIHQVLRKHKGELTYEAIMEMTYLDQFISETVRKYPAFASLTRFVKEDYQVPGTRITLEKGTQVHIPVKEIHHDPLIYDNPEEFRPERFNTYEIQRRHTQAFLAFGDGQRNCIGLRFARMQVRIGLITLLTRFKFTASDETPTKLKQTRHSLIMIPDTAVWLKVERLKSY